VQCARPGVRKEIKDRPWWGGLDFLLVPVAAEVLTPLPVTVPAVNRPVTLRLKGKFLDLSLAIGALKAHCRNIEHLARGETATALIRIESHI
jgi:hypothetical protein